MASTKPPRPDLPASAVPRARSPKSRRVGPAPALPADAPRAAEAIGSLGATVTGPARVPADDDHAALDLAPLQSLAVQKAGTQRLAAAMPFNAGKQGEHGLQGAGQHPQPGVHGEDDPEDPVSGSTVSEVIDSDKLGDGVPRPPATTLATVRWTGCGSTRASVPSAPTRACRWPTTRTR
jgi:hypothetical protein